MAEGERDSHRVEQDTLCQSVSHEGVGVMVTMPRIIDARDVKNVLSLDCPSGLCGLVT
jgi:hypothetical protein